MDKKVVSKVYTDFDVSKYGNFFYIHYSCNFNLKEVSAFIYRMRLQHFLNS